MAERRSTLKYHYEIITRPFICENETRDGNMASSDSKVAKSAKGKQLSQEQIVAGFQELRQQQKAVASKMSELDMERKEHE